ncbi:MAG: hypothetical protein Q9226_009388 [Calogaya cf. arnoldii]
MDTGHHYQIVFDKDSVLQAPIIRPYPIEAPAVDHPEYNLKPEVLFRDQQPKQQRIRDLRKYSQTGNNTLSNLTYFSSKFDPSKIATFYALVTVNDSELFFTKFNKIKTSLEDNRTKPVLDGWFTSQAPKYKYQKGQI